MELEHVIGQSKVHNGIRAIRSNTSVNRYVSAAGGCLVVNSVSDPHEQYFLRADDGPISSLRVSRSGRYILAGQHGDDHPDVTVWEILEDNFRIVTQFRDHTATVIDCDISPDDSIVASIGGEKRMCFYDMSNNGLITHMSLGGLIPDYDTNICSATGAGVKASNATSPACGGMVAFTHLCMGGRVQDVKRRETDEFHVGIVTVNSLFMMRLNPYTSSVTHTLPPNMMRVKLSSFLRQYTTGMYTDFGDLFILAAETGEFAVLSTDNASVLHTVQICSLGIKDFAMVCECPGAIKFIGDLNIPNGNENHISDVNNRIGDKRGIGGDVYQYANIGPSSKRSTTLYIGGGDGSIHQVKIRDHNEPTKVYHVAKAWIQEGGVASLTLLNTVSDCPSQVLVSNSLGSVFIINLQQQCENECISVIGSKSVTRGRRSEQHDPTDRKPNNHTCVRLSDSVLAPFDIVEAHPTIPSKCVTASRDGTLRCWDLNTYLSVGLLGEDSTVTHNALKKGDSKIQNTNSIISTYTPSGTTASPIICGITSSASISCSCICISESLETQLSSWSDGAIRCHDLTNMKLLWTHTLSHQCNVTALAVSKTLQFYVTGSQDGVIKVWYTRSKELRCENKGHGQAVIHLELFNDERCLLSASKDRTVCVWELGGSSLSSLHRVSTHVTHLGPLTGCKLSRTLQYFYTTGVDRKINVNDMRHLKEAVKSVDYNTFPTMVQNGISTASSRSGIEGFNASHLTQYLSKSTESYCSAFALSGDERYIVTGGSDKVVKLWDVKTMNPVSFGPAHSSPVTSVGITCDGKQALSCAHDNTLVIWNVYM